MNLFFGKAKAKATPRDSIVKLKETLQMLEKRQSFLETKSENEYKTAKLNATKNKRVALMALKRKKAFDQQIEKISGAYMTIETQVMAIESANVNLEAMVAMKTGAEAMKQIHGHMDISVVDKTMDEIRDQIGIANDISEAISGPIGYGEDVDEDELQAELEELEQQELDAKILDTPSPIFKSPAVPSQEPVFRVEEDDEAELAALQASMTM